MAAQLITITFFIVAALSLSSVLTKDDGGNADLTDCSIYTNINTTAATCNQVPGRTCTGGCSGYVTATKCTTSQIVDDQKPPLTTQKCTVSYGKSSATMAICITENQSFSCYGPVTGSAKCKGCTDSHSQTDKLQTNSTSGNTYPSTSSSTGNTDSSKSGNTSAGTALSLNGLSLAIVTLLSSAFV